MVDSIPPALRSAVMSRIRAKNTKPEMIVRRLLHNAGFRYRLHVANLPGKPDLVFPSRKKIIFVHGCFWHMHKGCALARIPKTRVEFWLGKLEGNRKRDMENLLKLQDAGWEILTVWECELKDPELLKKMISFLNDVKFDEPMLNLP